LITYESLGLCRSDEAHHFVDRDFCSEDNRHAWKINPSGGLISKGHPLGATGIAQICELVWQCRSLCGRRQTANVRFALAHNLGLGGAAVVTLLKGIANDGSSKRADNDKFGNLQYNPALECRNVTEEDFTKTVSKLKKSTPGAKL
jgi:sterol carrier protein 2